MAMPAPVPLDASAAETWARVKTRVSPSLLVDLVQGVLRDANEGGSRLWFGPRSAAAFPVALDAAMPALATLRAAGRTEQHTTLQFWTPRGALTRTADVLRLDDDVHAVVKLDEAATAVGAAVAEPAQAARSEGHAKLAHELRTPIGAVAAYAEVLAGEHFGPLGNARYREYAQNMRASAMHALAVIESMMGVAREDGARRELRFRDVDPADVIQSCVTVIGPIAAQSEVRLEVCVPEFLPRIVADEVSLRQMLLNLLTNAVKFARPHDCVSLGVTYADDGSLTFAVDDTGPGMSETRRADASAGAKGLGLGLPLTRELAEANGAALAIESAPGHGTRARISFGHTRVVV